jgi:hypothetical protein
LILKIKTKSRHKGEKLGTPERGRDLIPFIALVGELTPSDFERFLLGIFGLVLEI